MKKMSKTILSLGLVGSAVFNLPLAVADDTGWYIGGNIGKAKANIDDDAITTQLQSTGATSVSISDDDSDTAFKLFGGYQYSKHMAVEAGYFDLGEFGYTATTVPAGTLTGQAKINGVSLDLVGMRPLSEKFSVFGRIGLNYAQTEDNFTNTGTVPVPANAGPNKNDLSYKYGAGLQYDFSASLGARAEVERYRIDDAVGNKGDVDLLSLGLVYRFGDEKPAAAKPEKAPPPKAVRVIVPVKKMQEYCTVLDIEFEIKGSDIQPEDKEKLAVVATYMNKYPDTTAVVEGHSDNVGKSDYNLQLSQDRADSVVEYLKGAHKIDSSRLKAVGYGETRPIADNATTEGQQANRRINTVIACVSDIEGLKVTPARITMALEMEFDPYKSNIEPKYYDELAHVAKFMKANPSVTATVEAHAGKYLGTGADKIKVDPEISMNVSQLRAKNVVDYLVEKEGISSSRLFIAAYGQTGRVTYGTTLDEQQENRRVNIILNYAK